MWDHICMRELMSVQSCVHVHSGVMKYILLQLFVCGCMKGLWINSFSLGSVSCCIPRVAGPHKLSVASVCVEMWFSLSVWPKLCTVGVSWNQKCAQWVMENKIRGAKWKTKRKNVVSKRSSWTKLFNLSWTLNTLWLLKRVINFPNVNY